jgi:uncharacterized protein YlzI (FlbEa/FlbD family)
MQSQEWFNFLGDLMHIDGRQLTLNDEIEEAIAAIVDETIWLD